MKIIYTLIVFFVCNGMLFATTSYIPSAKEQWKSIKSSNGTTYIWGNDLSFFDFDPIQNEIEIVKINSMGRVAGNYGNRGFVWDPEFGFLDLGHLQDSLDDSVITRVIDMNENGEIVGCTYPKNGGLTLKSFLWKNGFLTPITGNSLGLIPVKITNGGEVILITYFKNGNHLKKLPYFESSAVDGAIAGIWKDGQSSFLFKDYNKLNTKYFQVLPLDMTEDGIVIFVRKMPTNRFHLFKYNRNTQEETFVKELTDSYFITPLHW